MTFNQWFACHGKELDGTSRLAFEAVWSVLERGGCSGSEASALLSDVVQSLPELVPSDGDEW